MKYLANVLISVGLIVALTGAVGLAENFCCNPETYVCEDCGMCPNPDCSTCDFEDSYDMKDTKGNVIGTVHIIKTAEITFMYQCFIIGNHSRCTGYFLQKN